jgi:hypothetical protein
VEGANSCLRYYNTTATWTVANNTCAGLGPRHQLLTSAQVVVGARKHRTSRELSSSTSHLDAGRGHACSHGAPLAT